MRKATILLFFAIFIGSKFNISANSCVRITPLEKIKASNEPCLSSQLAERGLEIRYYVFPKKPSTLPNEVVVDNVKYPLYKTKEEAIEGVKYSGLKKDFTIVYVVSDKKKNPEVVAIAD